MSIEKPDLTRRFVVDCVDVYAFWQKEILSTNVDAQTISQTFNLAVIQLTIAFD